MIDVGRDFERMRDYLIGALSEEERRSFEDRLVRDPALVREFEQSLQLREGLQALREEGYFASVPSRVRSLRMWLPALAAAGLAGLAVLLWAPRSAGPAALLMPSAGARAGDAAPLITAHFTFVPVRGSAASDLELPPGGLIEFRAAPAATEARYRVTLIHQDERGSSHPVGEVANLAVGADGYLHCYAQASRLAAGRYELRIEADAAGTGPPTTFAFSLRR
jgi:hypothetical protein